MFSHTHFYRSIVYHSLVVNPSTLNDGTHFLFAQDFRMNFSSPIIDTKSWLKKKKFGQK